MKEEQLRTALVIGEENLEKLKNKKVAIFGVGGVGGFATEAIARCGVGHIELIDSDVVSKSNINRQIIALESTVGMPKVEVMKRRIEDINPEIEVITKEMFILPENIMTLDFSSYDYIVDAIDTITTKIKLVEIAKEKNIKIISSMGTGNKMNPTMLEVSDINKTSVCPLAKVMRKELKSRGIKKLKVVYSKELPIKNNPDVKEKYMTDEDKKARKQVPGSISFVPSACGLIIASEVIKDLILE